MIRRFHWVLGVVLLAAFLLTGQYMDKVHRVARRLQLAGSAVVTAASVALVVAFFYDAPHANIGHLGSWWSRGAIYALVAGVLSHAAAGAIHSRGQAAHESAFSRGGAKNAKVISP
jgi:hypothetical protein